MLQVISSNLCSLSISFHNGKNNKQIKFGNIIYLPSTRCTITFGKLWAAMFLTFIIYSSSQVLISNWLNLKSLKCRKKHAPPSEQTCREKTNNLAYRRSLSCWILIWHLIARNAVIYTEYWETDPYWSGALYPSGGFWFLCLEFVVPHWEFFHLFGSEGLQSLTYARH